jgi:hypothetical protein
MPASAPLSPAQLAASGPVATTGSFLCPEPSGGADVTVTYDRSCKADADCVMAKQPTCCGPILALGMRRGEEKKVTTCRECAPRACAYGPLHAEDGGYEVGKDIVVACVKERCTTHFKK